MKDKRYATVKILIDTGHLGSLEEIFDTLPKTVIANDFGTNYRRFSRLLANPDQFTLGEIFTLAKLFDVDRMKMISLVISQYNNKNDKARK